MQGILVHGSNHFIVRGPLPGRKAARRLVRLWEIPELGKPAIVPPRLPWQMVNKAFREDLTWAVVLDIVALDVVGFGKVLTKLAKLGVSPICSANITRFSTCASCRILPGQW